MTLRVGNNMASGRAMSQQQFGLEFALIMIDVTIPKCNNLFPAVWMATQVGTNRWAELDLLETTDTKPTGTFNIITYTGSERHATSNTGPEWDASSIYVGEADCASRTWGRHTIAIHRTTNQATVYVDPVVTSTTTGIVLNARSTGSTYPGFKTWNMKSLPNGVDARQAQLPMYIVFNIGIAGYGGVTQCGVNGANCNVAPCTNNVGAQMIVHSVKTYVKC